jgi:hypothetical protein
MYYVCIEDNKVISVLNYSPNVPNTVRVVEIIDAAHDQLQAGTHRFDIATSSVLPISVAESNAKEAQQRNIVDLEFLRSTDWKVLRHIRQKALGVPTSLTEEEYLSLEQQRQAAAARIV